MKRQPEALHLISSNQLEFIEEIVKRPFTEMALLQNIILAYKKEPKRIEGIVNKILNLMIVLFDADSLLWSSCYKKKETPEDSPFNDNLEEVAFKFDEVFMSIINKLEEVYDITEVVTLCGSQGKFQKDANTYLQS